MPEDREVEAIGVVGEDEAGVVFLSCFLRRGGIVATDFQGERK